MTPLVQATKAARHISLHGAKAVGEVFGALAHLSDSLLTLNIRHLRHGVRLIKLMDHGGLQSD